MYIEIKWIGVMTIIFLTRHGGVNMEFYVKGKENLKNPRLIYFGDTIICDTNTVDYVVSLYFEYGRPMGSVKYIHGREKELKVEKWDNKQPVKESYITCGNDKNFLIMFFEKGNLSLARSTRIKHKLDYTVYGFLYICQGYKATNVIIETSHQCGDINRIQRINTYTFKIQIEKCYARNLTVSYRCIGFNHMGGMLSVSFEYTLIDKIVRKLEHFSPFTIMADTLKCLADLTYYSGVNVRRDYLLVVSMNKAQYTNVSVEGIKLEDYFKINKPSKFYYCCEDCDPLNLQFTTLKVFKVMRSYEIFFDVGKQLSLGEIVKCFVCALSTEYEPRVKIKNRQCQTTSINIIAERFYGQISASIWDGTKKTVYGPSDSIQIPSIVHTTVPINLTCKIREGLSKMASYKLTGCDNFNPSLEFFPIENLLTSGDRIYCKSKQTVCSNDFTFQLNITTKPKISYIYNDTQTIEIRPEHSGINVRIECYVYYKSNVSLHNISRTYRIDSKPGYLELFNHLPLRTVGDIIICHSTVSPIPTYKWILNGSLNPIYVYNHQLLLINTGIMEDNYNITCVATNYLGSNTTSTSIEIYNPFNKNQEQNFIFIFILVFTGVVYFFCLIVIISLVFAESVYRVHPKQERRKPKQVLGAEESTSHLDRYDIDLPYENDDGSYARENANRNDNINNLGKKEFSTNKIQNNNCRILSKNTRNIESIVPKNMLSSKRHLFLESDVIMKIADVNSESNDSKLNFTGHILNRSDDDYYLEENSNRRRQKISDEILSFQSHFCQKKT